MVCGDPEDERRTHCALESAAKKPGTQACFNCPKTLVGRVVR